MKAGVKRGLRWVILGGALFFLGTVLRRNWQGVLATRVVGVGWAYLATALGLTLLAHICAGWVWLRLLQDFKQPVVAASLVQGYLKTTIAKYLPGNVWHYYGRVTAATTAGASLATATVSVLLEPLLMAAAALLVTLLCSQQIAARYGGLAVVIQWVSFAGVLVVVHPLVLNPLVQRLGQLKQPRPSHPGPLKQSASLKSPDLTPPDLTPSDLTRPDLTRPDLTRPDLTYSRVFALDRYPWVPLIGELGFLLLRGLGFLLTFAAVSAFDGAQWPLILGAFSLAWLLGLVVPGAPGGIGVFESTAIALLGNTFAPGVLLSVVALYRLISVLAEAIGAGLATLDERLWG